MHEIIKMLKRHSEGMEALSLSMAVIEEGAVQRYFYDGQELSTDVPRLIYEIGSVTKTFTCSLLCKYLAEGRISLGDRIDQFIPGLDNGCEYPTVLQLATHTSGLGNDIDCVSQLHRQELERRVRSFSGDYESECIYSFLTEEDYIETLRATVWDNVSHEFQYSNVGFAVLGMILAKVGGKSYGELMRDYIERELQLKETSLDMPVNSKSGLILAKPYGLDNKPKSHWVWKNRIGMAAGAVYSTLDDMIMYIGNYLRNSPDYLEQSYIKAHAFSDVNHFGVGLSWIKEENIVWHNGATGCFHSFVGFREDKKKGVVLLENHHERNEINIDVIGKEILKSSHDMSAERMLC